MARISHIKSEVKRVGGWLPLILAFISPQLLFGHHGRQARQKEVKPTDKVGGEFCALLRIYKDAKMHGTIVVWSEPRAFGFVQPDGSTERLFVHITNFPKGQVPRLGAKIEFEIGDPISLGKKLQAVHARILEMPTDDAIVALASPNKPADTETPSEVLP